MRTFVDWVAVLILFLCATFLVSACVKAPEPEVKAIHYNITEGQDGYLFDGATFSANTAKIKIKRYNSTEDVTAAYARIFPDRDMEGVIIYGFTQYSWKGTESFCIIHILNPEVEYDPILIGHEFTHCINGDWHPTIP